MLGIRKFREHPADSRFYSYDAEIVQVKISKLNVLSLEEDHRGTPNLNSNRPKRALLPNPGFSIQDFLMFVSIGGGQRKKCLT
jgi:hypothetical protein